jgi:hypothetical protein
MTDEVPTRMEPRPAAYIEAVRQTLLGVRRRLRALQEQEYAGPLPLAQCDRRRRLQAEEQELAATLRQLLRTVPGDAAAE